LKPQIPWPRVFVEGVVIVGSILLAFGLQAWWEGRQERDEESRLLIDLRGEFVENRDLLRTSIQRHESFLASAQGLLDTSETQDEESRADVTQDAFQVFLSTTSFHPKSGVLDGLLSSGRLDLVSDGRLSELLAEWPRTVAEFTEQEVMLSDLMKMAMEASAPALSLHALAWDWSEGVEGLSLPRPPEPHLDDASVAFLRSREGQSHIAIRATYEWPALRDGRLLMGVIDEILALLEGQRRE